MVHKSMHGAIRAVHVLVDHPRYEVRSEGNDKCLGIVVGMGVGVHKIRTEMRVRQVLINI